MSVESNERSLESKRLRTTGMGKTHLSQDTCNPQGSILGVSNSAGVPGQIWTVWFPMDWILPRSQGSHPDRYGDNGVVMGGISGSMSPGTVSKTCCQWPWPVEPKGSESCGRSHPPTSGSPAGWIDGLHELGPAHRLYV